MVLHDIKEVSEVIKTLTSLLKKNGTFTFSIPHPSFYTELGKAYFDGTNPVVQVKKYKSPHHFAKFNDNKRTGVRHYHRPLSEYFKCFFELGYVASGFEEIFEKSKDAQIPFAVLFTFTKKKTGTTSFFSLTK
jgi:hypothetical protein